MTYIYILIFVIVLILIIALFLKKEYSVIRHVEINKPLQDVFDYIRLLKNQDLYSVWASMDPNMKKEHSGTDGTVGFVSAWESNQKNVGKGTQTIKSIVEGERIKWDLHFIKPFEGLADAYMNTTSKVQGKTTVQWGISSKMKYPMNIMLLFLNLEKKIGDDLSAGLSNLKKNMEK